MKRGPYTIVRDLPSGSYELQLLGKPKSQIIKKHGSDIYLCPKEINHYTALDSLYKAFFDIDKKPVSSPYQHAGVKYYTSKSMGSTRNYSQGHGFR